MGWDWEHDLASRPNRPPPGAWLLATRYPLPATPSCHERVHHPRVRHRPGPAEEAAGLLPGEIRHAALGLPPALPADGEAAQPRPGRRGRGLREVRRARRRALHVPRAQRRDQPARPHLPGPAGALPRPRRRGRHPPGISRHRQAAVRLLRRALPRPPALRHLRRLQPERLPPVFPPQLLADPQPDARGQFQPDQHRRAQRQPHRHRPAPHLCHRHPGHP